MLDKIKKMINGDPLEAIAALIRKYRAKRASALAERGAIDAKIVAATREDIEAGVESKRPEGLIVNKLQLAASLAAFDGLEADAFTEGLALAVERLPSAVASVEAGIERAEADFVRIERDAAEKIVALREKVAEARHKADELIARRSTLKQHAGVLFFEALDRAGVTYVRSDLEYQAAVLQQQATPQPEAPSPVALTGFSTAGTGRASTFKEVFSRPAAAE